MASILIHTADESVTLTAQTVKRLLDRGDGDAAPPDKIQDHIHLFPISIF